MLKGGNPDAAKTAARAEPTHAVLCCKFMEDYFKLHNKPSTQRDYWAKDGKDGPLQSICSR